jgi:hypothetical protein
MEGRCVKKVPNGKLLKVEIDVRDNKLKYIKIMGDFFAHPEDSIEKLEERLGGSAREQVEDKTRRFFMENTTTLYGVDAKTIAETILEAWDGMPAT